VTLGPDGIDVELQAGEKDRNIIADDKKNKKSQSNLGRAASPPLTAENNYATKSPLITLKCHTFTPKTALSLSKISTPI